ncbi:MAG: FAD-dependent oxidoreductase [Bacteroidales bacterium]|nr:FAD-dependent oxidoreductase [Bacteroidales bacterium]
MPRTIEIDLRPEVYHSESLRLQAIARRLSLKAEEIDLVQVQRRSIDARRGIHYHVVASVYVGGEAQPSFSVRSPYRMCHQAPPVVIVGAGPAGLFAALHALEVGLRPVIIERGRPVNERGRDIAQLGQSRHVDSESNWCFGEGGAGTYSDGKLYTRSTKRGDVGNVLRKFVEHGANPDILIDTHAHIGTDKLSGIMAQMRTTIEGHGGEYHFRSRVVDLIVEGGRVQGVRCADGSTYHGVATLLATGHSARDIYHLFHSHGWLLEAKPFALGVRVEHPQPLINSIQYHTSSPSPLLPPAAYSLKTQVGSHGVFSFCMCPGGVIVPAATAEGQQVVNGMSNSHRSSPLANSGIAVTVSASDVPTTDALSLMRWQQAVEEHMFRLAGGTISAPAQRLTDFCTGRTSRSLNASGYIGPLVSAPLHEELPPFITSSLQEGLRQFGRKMRGFYTSEANLLAVESRTSSPVRIPRQADGQHPQLPGLYPCGEGAGYAGGIVSSAIDGIEAISLIAQQQGL